MKKFEILNGWIRVPGLGKEIISKAIKISSIEVMTIGHSALLKSDGIWLKTTTTEVFLSYARNEIEQFRKDLSLLENAIGLNV